MKATGSTPFDLNEKLDAASAGYQVGYKVPLLRFPNLHPHLQKSK
jgi:hypothetical protein